jgi:CDP-glucose 4,6-dehydratase
MDKINMRDILNSFSGKRVLITGHTGFKGAWLTFILKQFGADVMGFALPPATTPNHFDLLDLKTDIEHVIGDIRDSSAIISAMNSFKPEYVFHLAAQALVKKSYNEPVDTFDTNVMGAVNLLDSVRQSDSVRSLVFITSDKCYENVEWVWGYRETDRLGGHDPYSASKAAAEIIFSAYSRSFFLSKSNLGVASARAGNVIGGGDWSENRIIPDCIRALEKNRPIELRNPGATRPWQHVLEPLSGYILLASKLYNEPEQHGGSWNFGPSTSEVRTVEEVANSIIKHFGYGRVVNTGSKNKQHEANLLQLNCDKAHQILGWQPKWNIDETITATAQWYKTILGGGDAKLITSIQIDNFFS